MHYLRFSLLFSGRYTMFGIGLKGGELLMDFKDIKVKVLTAVSGAVAFLATAPHAFAQAITPVPVEVPTEMKQLALDGVVSIQQGFFSIVALVWPYVLILVLGFLAIRFGMGMIHRRGV
jgi:hypothetical protein